MSHQTSRPELDFSVPRGILATLTLIVLLLLFLYGAQKVLGYSRTAGEAERILREYPRR